MDPVAELAECKEMWNEVRQEAAKLAFDLLDITAERDALREAFGKTEALSTKTGECSLCSAETCRTASHEATCPFARLATSERAEKGEGR